MAMPSRKPSRTAAPPVRALAPIRPAKAEDRAAPLPAQASQELLHEQWRETARHAAEPPKWSQRRTLAFLALTCGGFWTCVVLGVARLAH